MTSPAGHLEGTSLVADYSSSSDSENSVKESIKIYAGNNNCAADSENLSNKLPAPAFNRQDDPSLINCNIVKGSSVFSNPYRDAEEANISALEKHVRMTSPMEKLDEINGRQICWNYRKGKCRFGHNCKFAHDSDIPVDNRVESLDTQNSNMKFLPQYHFSQYDAQCLVTMDENGNEEDGECDVDGSSKKKKRPGLCSSLVPSKKVMKQYYKQQQLESPWSVLK